VRIHLLRADSVFHAIICAVILLILTPGCSDNTAQKQAMVCEASPEDIKTLVECNSKFAFDLLAQLKADHEQKNLFFSPFSISSALAMTYAGARGETADEMKETLCFDLDTEYLHSAFSTLMAPMDARAEDQGYELCVANALWGQEDYRFLDDFLTLVQSNYGAGLRKVDFRNDVEKARLTINQWVEEKTHEKIKDLIPKGVLKEVTRLVLTNAIYFKGAWASKFKENATKNRSFHTTEEKKIDVPMMTQSQTFPFVHLGGVKILELPYESGILSMFVFLPDQVDGLADLESSLTAEKLATWLSRLEEQELRVYLPKFKFTSTFKLNNTLQELGMTQAFLRGRADFSGMDGTHMLFIQDVLHKAFVDVNEEGTEAAGATAVLMSLGYVSSDSKPVFNADHPFLFLIRHNPSNSILFMGHVKDPSE